MTPTQEQSTIQLRSSGTLRARQYRVMGVFLITLAVIVIAVIVLDFWKRLGSAAPILVMACVMDVIAGIFLLYLGRKKARLERNG